MSALRRTALVALLALGSLAASAAPALAHANVLTSIPRLNERIHTQVKTVVIDFSEPVTIVGRNDVTVVDGRGVRVDKGLARTPSGDPRKVLVPLVGPLLPNTYTVRYRVVSADSHAAAGAFRFVLGSGPLKPPILAGTGGLSDTSPAAVGARVAELVALGLLLGLIAFRALIFGPAVAAAGPALAGREREEALRRGQRQFWRAFWALAVLAGLAETAVLAAKSAVVFHTGFLHALVSPAAAYRLVGVSRFGDILGWRCGALAALLGVAFVAWTLESGAPPSAGRRGLLTAMAGCGLATLLLLSGQGHASQAPLAPLSVAADAVHLAGAAIWIGGLPCLLAVLLRAPKVLPDGGRALASATLRRFSKVALWSVVAIAITGVVRMLGELGSPADLWSTGYGRDLMLKASLLLPILIVARRNRRFVAALSGGLTPTAARLRSVARSVQIELAIAAGIITLAALLVAQVPGRI